MGLAAGVGRGRCAGRDVVGAAGWRRRSGVVAACAAIALIATGCSSSGHPSQSSQAAPPSSTGGTQVSTAPISGAGIGSAAALAAPNCDPSTKRVRLPSFVAPPCVDPWPSGSNNGGATAQGVTTTSVKVVVLVAGGASDKTTAPGVIYDQATKSAGTEQDAVLDNAAMFSHVMQTWGRTVQFQFVQASGADEAAQRADAVAVRAMKPFAVIDAAEFAPSKGTIPVGGGTVFDQAVSADPNIVLVGGQTLLALNHGNDDIAVNSAGFIGKELANQPAKWAGDPSMQQETRRFGVIYQAGQGGLPITLFDQTLATFDVKAALEESYTPPADATTAPALYQQLAPTIIAKMKSAGVNNIVMFTDGSVMGPALTNAAASQDYYPEWTITGFSVQDLDLYQKFENQKEWAHAFGTGWFTPYVVSEGDPLTALFDWFWGAGEGTRSDGYFADVYDLYASVQLAGPSLTVATFTKALSAIPPAGGAASGQVTTYENVPAKPGLAHDFTLVWWNPNATGVANVLGNTETGVEEYVNGGKRYAPGQEPSGPQPFFDPSQSVLSYPTLPASDTPPSYACTGCPSSGGGPAPANVG